MNIPNAYEMTRWIHFLCIALAGGGMVICLMVSGFEDTREDLRGLAAALWARTVSWAFRLGLLSGIVLVVWSHFRGGSPFSDTWLWVKLVLVVALFGLSESTPKALAAGKRGAAMLAMLVFLLTTFLASTYLASYRGLFGGSVSTRTPAVMSPGH